MDICLKILSCISVKDIWIKLKEMCGNKESLAKKESPTTSIYKKGKPTT